MSLSKVCVGVLAPFCLFSRIITRKRLERGTFTPLVMGTNGEMGEECSRFLSQLANKLAAKQNETYNTVITWIRTKLSYELLRSVVLCVRGSRIPYKSGQRELTFEFTLDSVEARIV